VRRALRDLETGNRKRSGCGNFCVLIEHSNTGEQYRGILENDETVQRAGNRRLLRRSDTRVSFVIGNKSRRLNIVLSMKAHVLWKVKLQRLRVPGTDEGR